MNHIKENDIPTSIIESSVNTNDDKLIKNLTPVDFSSVIDEAIKNVLLPQEFDYRFFQLKEISEIKSNQCRLSMSNVLSGMRQTESRLVYLLSGTEHGVELYIGIACKKQQLDIHDMGESLKHSFEGNFLGSQLEKVSDAKINQLKMGKHLGFISGIPSFNEDESGGLGDTDVQGIERLVNSLTGKNWQLTIVSEAVSHDEIRQQIAQLYDISTELSQYIKLSFQKSKNSGLQMSKSDGSSKSDTTGTSETDSRGKSKGVSETKGDNQSHSSDSGKKSSGTNSSKTTNDGTNESSSTGKSDSHTEGSNTSHTLGYTSNDGESYSRESMNHGVESLHKYITETLINRYRLGQTKGFFKTAIYVSADNQAIYERLKNGVLALFQGNQPNMIPMTVHNLATKQTSLDSLLSFRTLDGFLKKQHWKENALLQGIPFDEKKNALIAATAITAKELALLTNIPSVELHGIKIRKSVDFAVNVPDVNKENAITLGGIIQHGRNLGEVNKGSTTGQVFLNKKDFNKHTFICGVTGAGKTTTCMRLLLESDLPFMVIEPAKTEYRALYGRCENIEYYAVGREDLTPFRLNPFELVKGEQLTGHIQILNATLQAVFPMEAAMPYMVEEAIVNAYKNKGWDIYSNENFLVDDPWEKGSNAYPTFSDMIQELDGIISSKGLGKEFEEKYRGSLVARFTNLTLGIKGRMLNTRHSMDFDQLLDKKVVIELEEIKDEQDKALFMGLIIVRLAESMKHRHQKNRDFQHLTLIEEAHRLLSRLDAGESGSKKLGIEMFSNLLAEVRKYGEGLIIADQIPNKLVPDVIKNTNTKIVHRLFAADDRNVIGDTMSLNDEQKDFLPLLKVGEAVVYSGGWHAPVWVKVHESQNTSEQAIDEALIKQKGSQQLWQQREALFPNLTKHQVLTEKSLSHFLTDGLSIINAMLKIKEMRSSGTSSQITTMKERLHQMLSKKFNYQLLNAFGNDKQVLCESLADLFLDVAHDMDTSDEFREALFKIFSALIESLSAFETICSDRAIKYNFDKIKINSI